MKSIKEIIEKSNIYEISKFSIVKLDKYQEKTLIQSIQKELNYQFDKFGKQEHSIFYWYSILMEEIGEIAKELNESNDYMNLRNEIVQSITLLVQILHKIGCL